MNTTTKTPAKTPAPTTPPPDKDQSSSLQLPPSEERKKRRSWLTLLAGSLGILLVGFLVMGLVLNQETPTETVEELKPNSTTPEDSLKKPWYHPIAETVRKWTTKQSVLPANLITKRVSPGRFRITINEKGFLNSQRNETLTSLVPGATTIISIVPEGTYVQEGDIVCELDSSALEEKARQQEIDVTKADAAFSAAKENLEIQKNQNDSDIAIATLTLELAKLDLQKYLEGELPQQQGSIDGQIRLKQEELARKRESYEFIKRMAKKRVSQPFRSGSRADCGHQSRD